MNKNSRLNDMKASLKNISYDVIARKNANFIG